MGPKDRGPRPQVDEAARLLTDLRTAFVWRTDRGVDTWAADPSGWWADPSILRRLGPALADLFAEHRPTIILGPQSRGALLGALVALHLGVGLVELRKNPRPFTDSDRWVTARTPPDYQDRNLEVGVRLTLLPPTSRVLFVDDWVDTGGQAVAARALVDRANVTWCGAAVVVDALTDARLRRDLDVRALVREKDL